MKASPQKAISDHLQALNDFNVRVRRLSRFGLYELAKVGHLRTAAQAALGERGRRGSRHPTQEQIDALVNNLRFFVQNNEATSFQNLTKSYDALPLPKKLKKEFNRCCVKLNRWLDSKTSLGMNGAPLTHRAVFDTFIYGDIAHQNPAKRQLFDQWRQNRNSFRLWETLFVQILGRFSKFLDEAASVNEKALNYLNG